MDFQNTTIVYVEENSLVNELVYIFGCKTMSIFDYEKIASSEKSNGIYVMMPETWFEHVDYKGYNIKESDFEKKNYYYIADNLNKYKFIKELFTGVKNVINFNGIVNHVGLSIKSSDPEIFTIPTPYLVNVKKTSKLFENTELFNGYCIADDHNIKYLDNDQLEDIISFSKNVVIQELIPNFETAAAMINQYCTTVAVDPKILVPHMGWSSAPITINQFNYTNLFVPFQVSFGDYFRGELPKIAKKLGKEEFHELFEKIFTFKRDKERVIPKIIHQIWLGEPPSEKIAAFMKTVKDKYTGFKYNLWDEEKIKSLKLTNLKLIYENIQKKNYKVASDILRAEILNTYGGIYIDSDFEVIKPIPYAMLKNNDMVITHDTPIITNLTFSNGFIASIPNNPVLEFYIKYLKYRNVNKSFQLYSGNRYLSQCLQNRAVKILDGKYLFPVWNNGKEERETAEVIKDMDKENIYMIHHWKY